MAVAGSSAQLVLDKRSIKILLSSTLMVDVAFPNQYFARGYPSMHFDISDFVRATEALPLIRSVQVHAILLTVIKP